MVREFRRFSLDESGTVTVEHALLMLTILLISAPALHSFAHTMRGLVSHSDAQLVGASPELMGTQSPR